LNESKDTHVAKETIFERVFQKNLKDKMRIGGDTGGWYGIQEDRTVLD